MNKKIEIPACSSCQSRVYSIFNETKESELNALSANKCGNLYKKGQVIYYEGNKPLGLFCINKGKVKVYKTNSEGKEQILRLAKDGDVIGYASLMNGELYSSSASVLEDAMICYVPKNVFLNLVQSNSSLSLRVIQLLSHDMNYAETRIANTAYNSVRERLAETLLMLKEFSGYESDQTTLKTALSREDLANMVGTATETVIRLLSEFNHEKMISIEGRKIKILDYPSLMQAANIAD
jgi:CRP/FNR family transcriptional regulator